MATSTTNLGLTKPAGTDKIRIAQINGNMDILDEKIGAVGNTSLQAQVTSQNQAIAKYEPALGDTLTDCNTAKDNGNYPIYPGTTSNIPANNARVLEVFRRSNNIVFQRSLCTDGTTYTRYTQDGGTTWSAWEGLALNSKIETVQYNLSDVASDLVSNVSGNVIKTGNVVSIYISGSALAIAQVIGRLNSGFRPKVAYAILSVYDSNTPYQPVNGSLWISTNGNMEKYGSTSGNYVYGTFIVDG